MAAQPAADSKTPRKKTDRKLVIWIGVIFMVVLVLYLFVRQGPDLGQGKINAERAKKAQAAQAKLYSSKVSNPKAAAQAQYAQAQLAHAHQVQAQQAQQLAAQRKALAARLASASSVPILPPPSPTLIDNARANNLSATAKAIGASGAHGNAPVDSFVVFESSPKKSHHGGLLRIKAPAPSSSALPPPASPELKQAQAQLAAAEHRREQTHALEQAKAQLATQPGAENDQAWLFQDQNHQVALAKPLTATRADARYWLAPGTVIHAVIQDAINTHLPGVVTARVTHTVYDSRYGRYRVIPAGSVLTGSYNTSVADGQHRVMLAFDTLITPSGGMVDLGAMTASDGMGRGGVPGKLHTRFWSRMGIAALLAVEASEADKLSGGQQIALPSEYGAGSEFNGGSSGGAVMENFANGEIARRMAVGPYITVPPGTVATLTLAQGVDIPPIANTR